MMREQEFPLVSCILPTGGRPAFRDQAMRYFDRQDYPRDRRELIVEDYADRSAGINRNNAIARANGEIILLWDDDDYYSSRRIIYQVGPIITGEADMTALQMDVVVDLARWIGYRCQPGRFPGYVLGGTLAFRRAIFDEVQYADMSDGEDSYFVHRAVIAGARLLSMPMNGHYVYVRHPGTKAVFTPGTFFKSEVWKRVMPEETALGADLDWYCRRFEEMRMRTV